MYVLLNPIDNLARILTYIGFDENDLLCIVNMVAAESKVLLEIVNFNVEGEQYVCTGAVSCSIPNSTCQQH